MVDIATLITAVLGGGGAGVGAGIATAKIIIKEVAKEALKEDLQALKDEDKALHSRINKVEDEYTTCRYCDNQHKNLDANLDKMDKKLDTILEKL